MLRYERRLEREVRGGREIIDLAAADAGGGYLPPPIVHVFGRGGSARGVRRRDNAEDGKP